jgi:Fe-S oxidoreductase
MRADADDQAPLKGVKIIMFIESMCDFCGECLAKCQYIDMDRQQGSLAFKNLVQEKSAEWLKKCVTCFACNEYCPTGARPFDLILRRMEGMGNYVDPQLLAAVRDRFTAKGDFQPPTVKGPVLSLCTIEAVIPWAFEGRLFAGLDVVKGRHYFCNVLFPHLGNEAIMREGIKPLVDKYAALGAEEIIFAHDDCYALMTDAAPQYGVELPFRPIHIFEYLARYLKSHGADIEPLHWKVAYQRPCASRLTPGKEDHLDEIFRLIGVERVARRYDREDALCCGQTLKGFMQRGEKYPAYQALNIEDARKHGARAMGFLCPMCLDAMGRPCRDAGLETYMVSDLCRLALGETLPDGAYGRWS